MKRKSIVELKDESEGETHFTQSVSSKNPIPTKTGSTSSISEKTFTNDGNILEAGKHWRLCGEGSSSSLPNEENSRRKIFNLIKSKIAEEDQKKYGTSLFKVYNFIPPSNSHQKVTY